MMLQNHSKLSTAMQRVGKGEQTEELKVITITPDGGLVKTILKEGIGDVIPVGKSAKVHYTGKLLDGTVFDSSRQRGTPFTFTVGNGEVISGWDNGVATMKKGEICTLRCAPQYAYGRSGTGPIPPNATLLFEVELLDWEDAPMNLVFVAVSILTAMLIVYYFMVLKK